jgi:prevent-host-death family protein
MDITATEAKNRLGQMLEHAQREPVYIAKSGRRHSVLISAGHYEALLAAQSKSRSRSVAEPGREFYARYKEWVDQQNRLVEQAGIPCEEFRPW